MPWGGSLLEVSASTMEPNRPGYFSTVASPKTPPIESPTQCVRFAPKWSSSPLMSSAIMSSVYGIAGAEVSPWPRES